MELLFLGTSAGAPTKTRNMTALAIRRSHAKQWYLVDCAEGTQHQILHTNLTLNSLQAVFITHMHGDHCYGLPGLLDSAAMAGRKDKLLIVGPKEIQRFIQAMAYSNDLERGFELQFIDVEQLNAPLEVGAFEVEAHALSHRVASFAYSFRETAIPAKLDTAKLQQVGVSPGPDWRKLQQGQDITLANGTIIRATDYLLAPATPRKIIIGGDNDTPELLSNAAQDADVLVHEATYVQEIADKVGTAPQHCSAKKIAQFAQQVGLPNLILTHFSPRYQNNPAYSPSIADIANEARLFYTGNLLLANDFDLYRLDKNGSLQLEQS